METNETRGFEENNDEDDDDENDINREHYLFHFPFSFIMCEHFSRSHTFYLLFNPFV